MIYPVINKVWAVRKTEQKPAADGANVSFGYDIKNIPGRQVKPRRFARRENYWGSPQSRGFLL
jgi:hypothetical protein